MTTSACRGVDIHRERLSPTVFPFFLELTMACNCNNVTRYRASSVAVATGVTTITIPATPEINAGDVFEILLATPIPDGTDGTQVVITNGIVTGNLMNGNGNYFRPMPLTSRTVFLVQFLGDPSHFQTLKIYGKGCCRG